MAARAAGPRLIDLECGRDGRGQWGDVERVGLMLAARCNQIGRDDCKTILSAGSINESLDHRRGREGLPGE